MILLIQVAHNNTTAISNNIDKQSGGTNESEWYGATKKYIQHCYMQWGKTVI
jgi:hypothetical protein